MEKQTVEVDAPIEGKTILSFSAPTPKWATYMFRTEFILNKAVSMYLAGTQTIPQNRLGEYILIVSIIDFAFWAVARSLGVKKSDFEDQIA